MCVCLPEVLAQGRRVVGQQCVDQAEQLHDSLVLPQVLVALQQEHELVAIAACRGRHTTQRRCTALERVEALHGKGHMVGLAGTGRAPLLHLHYTMPTGPQHAAINYFVWKFSWRSVDQGPTQEEWKICICAINSILFITVKISAGQ